MSPLTNVMPFYEGLKLFFRVRASRGQPNNQMFKNRREQNTQRKARKKNFHLSSAPPRPLLFVALDTAVTHTSTALLLWQNQITHSSSIGTTHECREGKNVLQTTESFFFFFSLRIDHSEYNDKHRTKCHLSEAFDHEMSPGRSEINFFSTWWHFCVPCLPLWLRRLLEPIDFVLWRFVNMEKNITVFITACTEHNYSHFVFKSYYAHWVQTWSGC